MYTNKDIRCFVMTRNRPDLLKQTLKTLLWQIGGPFDIWVIDNSTNEDTANLIKKEYPQVHYEHTIGGALFLANLEKMKSLMTTPYTLTLHDDDLLAPDYLVNALKLLNYYNDVSLLFGKGKVFYGLDFPQELEEKSKKQIKNGTRHWLIENQKDFAFAFWDRPNCYWSGSIIKSSLYKNIDFKFLLEKYGKIFDWIMLIESFKEGKAIILTDKYFYYRLHQAQYTTNDATGINLTQIASWFRYFKNFADTKKDLKNMYIIHGQDFFNSMYHSFLKSSEREKVKDYMTWFLENNLIFTPMKFYSLCKAHKYLMDAPRHLFRRFYKKNYYKQFLQEIK